jgi:hypothetical protein
MAAERPDDRCTISSTGSPAAGRPTHPLCDHLRVDPARSCVRRSTQRANSTQLDEQARQFVNDPFRNRSMKQSRTAHLSKSSSGSTRISTGQLDRRKNSSRAVADADVAQGLGGDAYKVEWIDYDWNLNGTPPRR